MECHEEKYWKSGIMNYKPHVSKMAAYKHNSMEKEQLGIHLDTKKVSDDATKQSLVSDDEVSFVLMRLDADQRVQDSLAAVEVGLT